MFGVDVDPVQLDLLRDPTTGRLPTDVFRRVRAGEVARRGRPPGARNKRNAKLAQLIAQQHGDPVMFLASVYAMPLDQLVEMMQNADGSAAREERLLDLVEQAAGFMTNMNSQVRIGIVNPKTLQKLADTVERVVNAAAVLRSKPGELAAKAFAAQVVAAKEVAPYMHGKQPLTVDVTGKADMVLLIPGLNAPAGVDAKVLQAAVEQHGIDAIDFENMQLIEHAPQPDAELQEDEEDA
ncbi:MAG TPA: hypothetical protein VFW22_16250 [Pseudolabrys sp.]|nr:hypothetical protein [Pseudolabrys sp.]